MDNKNNVMMFVEKSVRIRRKIADRQQPLVYEIAEVLQVSVRDLLVEDKIKL